jgi:Malectin domain
LVALLLTAGPTFCLFSKFFTEVGLRVFDILIENTLVVNDLDVFDQVGAFAPLVVSFQTTISDGNATIRFREELQNPFICAIEILEVESNETSLVMPSSAPISVPPEGEVRVNAGGPRYIDSLGNTWVGDKFFKGKGAVSNVSCPGNITNTLDSALLCTQRYFPSSDALPFAYNVPVNETSQYLVRLYFSEMVRHALCREVAWFLFTYNRLDGT